MKEVLVSVVCNTYNHEKYIKDALDGFLTQKTDFQYEIVLYDDASTDKTADIIRKYEAIHQDIIHAIYQKENQYSKKKNFLFMREVYFTCRGKYIAFCEGDDFWIDTHKLQMQVDFLEKHSDYILTAHNAIRLNCGDGTIDAINPYDCDKTLSPKEIIMQYHGNIPTASMVMRTDVLKKIDDLFWEYDVDDWLFQLACIPRGKIYYFDRIMSLYRYKHKDSWTATWEEDLQKHFEHGFGMIEFLERYNKYTNSIYEKHIVTRIQGYVKGIINMRRKQRKSYTLRCMKYEHYLEEINRVSVQMYDVDYYDRKLNEFILSHRHIVIFGAGDYASRLTIQLDNHNIPFDGYAISEKKGKRGGYLGKPVWHLSEIPYSKEETGVIIAIDPIIWDQIIDSLEKYSITDYTCPFLFNA